VAAEYLLVSQNIRRVVGGAVSEVERGERFRADTAVPGGLQCADIVVPRKYFGLYKKLFHQIWPDIAFRLPVSGAALVRQSFNVGCNLGESVIFGKEKRRSAEARQTKPGVSVKILVIGGAGYIGSHVVREFLDSSYSVTVFDNLSFGTRRNLFGEARFFHGDIMQPMQLHELMAEGFDGCVHLAALKAAGESMVKPDAYARMNLAGTINILNAALSSNVPNMIFSSSAAIFGSPRYLPIDEDHPKEPENFYGFTKLEIERLMEWYDRLKGMKYASIRYFNAAGYDVQGRIQGREMNPENLLPIVMETASGVRKGMKVFGNDYPTRDGTCIRDYVHVTDLSRAHVTAFEHLVEKKESLSVNLGSETGVTVLEMIEKAREITGCDIPAAISERRPGDPAELVAASKKAREILGWEPRYSDLDTLIDSTWQVYKKNHSI
jgi:UDP-glucose 4-epimerase